MSPDGQWISQLARQLTDGIDGFARGKTHLIIDGDTTYRWGFRQGELAGFFLKPEARGINRALIPARVQFLSGMPQCRLASGWLEKIPGNAHVEVVIDSDRFLVSRCHR